MSIDNVQRKPPPPAARPPTPPAAPSQDSSAFAARMKKAAVEQGKSSRPVRRDDARTSTVDDASATGLAFMGADVIAVRAAAQRQHDGQDGQSRGAMQEIGQGDPAEALDTDMLTEQLAPLAANDGLFEVLLPHGKKLSVAVSATAGRIRFLLSTDADDLNKKLKQKKKELEQRLGRRTGRDVVLTIL